MPIQKYGREFATDSLLDVELWAFRTRLTKDQGGLGGAKHFENIVREIWPDFIWYSDAYDQAEALCDNDISGFTSGASNSKSDLLGKFGETSWFADPINTLVIVCSTSSTDAKQRIWGHMVRDFRKARAQGKAVGKLVETQAIIKLSESTDGVAASDNSSICLVAAGDQFKDDALKRLQGKKNKHVILLLDELQDCSQEIIKEALWNLNANAKWEVHAAGNASSRFNSHGIFMAPTDGWPTINRTTRKWEIMVGGKRGIGMHFDATAENSPNMTRFAQGLPQLPFLRKAEDIMMAKSQLGENNPTYMRQFVGFWPDSEGESNYLITEQEIVTHQASGSMYWQSPPTDFAGLDPSYSAGGDRFIFAHLQYGMSTHGVWTVFCKEAISVKVHPQPGETKDYAAVRQCKKIAEERNISPRNIGTDASAATSFTSILHKEWSPEILPVPFGGAPTDLAVSFYDKRLASDIYCDRSTELLGVWHEFVIQGQIRGMSAQHVKEVTSRQFKHVGAKIRLESKKDMKARLGYSPDEMDGFNIGLATIRDRLKVVAGASAAKPADNGDWKALQKRNDVVSRSSSSRRMRLA